MRYVTLIPLLAAASCSKTDASKVADTKSTATEGTVIPLEGAHFAAAPMGAPDAIEPPSRDILPGMTVAEAKAKGAKVDTVDYMLKWRPDTGLWLDKKSQLVSRLEVSYPAKQWETLQAKWGKPNFGGAWLGANWLASLNGCASVDHSCGVTFTRSPLGMLSKSVVPPGPIARLHRGMTAKEVDAAVGLPLDQADPGYGVAVSGSYDGDRLTSVTLRMIGQDDWVPLLTKLWGAPGANNEWANTKDRWMAQVDDPATLRFSWVTPLAELLAKTGPDSVLAKAHAALGKPHAALAQLPGFVAEPDRFEVANTEYSASAPPELTITYGDQDMVSELTLRIPTTNEAATAKVLRQLATSWGPVNTAKNQDGDQVSTIQIDGVKAAVESSGDGVVLHVTK
jgi:hypothetical protein